MVTKSWWGGIALAVLTMVCACGGDSGKPDPCAQGICANTSGGDNGATGGAAISGGSNTSGGNVGGSGGISSTGGMAGSGGSGTTGGMSGSGGSGSGGSVSGCTEDWLCSPWATNGSDDNGTRTCVDRNSCGSTSLKPVETATLAALDFPFYQCNVEPILDRSCAHLGCHGTEQGRALRVYARGRLRITGDTIAKAGGTCSGSGTAPSESCTGVLECHCWFQPHTTNELRANFDAARGFALDASGQPLSDTETSELLAQPLIGGGLPHAGIKMWATGSQDYNTVRDWLAGQSQSNCGLPYSNN